MKNNNRVYKKEIIEAVLKLIIKYKEKLETPCPFCRLDLAKTLGRGKCKTCPNILFTHCNYRLTQRLHSFNPLSYNNNNHIAIEFWTKALKELKKVPAKYFNIIADHKEQFQFLIEIDKEVYNKYKDKI